MLDLAFKNIKRQRTRAFLTVLGIVIGIAAVVSLGSLSEGLNQLVQNNLELTAGKIVVAQAGSSGFLIGFAGSELTDEDLSEIQSVSGVKEVVPQLYAIGEIIPFEGPAWVAIGIEPSKTEFFAGENIKIEKGRSLEDGDGEVIVAGANFADEQNLDAGDFFAIKDTELEVVGIFEKSGQGDIDNNFIVPLNALQDITEQDFFQTIYVIPDDLTKIELIAERIENENEKYDALTSTDIARQAGMIVSQIRLFTLGMGAIAALVGGLGIMNTMIMSVLERRREIGVMKAVGGTKRFIIRQFLTESVLISFIGGLIGIGFGFLGARLMEVAFSFTEGAVITPALIIGSLAFAVILGIAGGLYPAYKAANLDPVEALRYE